MLGDGDGFIFMKIGTHGQEDLKSIIERKRKEIADAGFAMWGYGGNTCHPVSMVRPFAADLSGESKSIHLMMEPMVSNHWAPGVAADEYSTDKVTWQPIDKSVHQVRGSRFALFIDSLDDIDFDLDLTQTVVGTGAQEGRSGVEYVRGRVDKACLRYRSDLGRNLIASTARHNIRFAARLVEPYAAMLRNRD